MIDEVLEQDVCIVRGFQLAVGIRSTLFDPEVLSKKYGDEKVDIVR
jgi:hypothetical protein